jgi:hypothetical protein
MSNKVKTYRPELPFQWACPFCSFCVLGLYEKDLKEGIKRHQQKCEAEKKLKDVKEYCCSCCGAPVYLPKEKRKEEQ